MDKPSVKLTTAQERDLLKLYDLHQKGFDDSTCRTGRFLVDKELAQRTRFYAYPYPMQYYALTEEGKRLAESISEERQKARLILEERQEAIRNRRHSANCTE